MRAPAVILSLIILGAALVACSTPPPIVDPTPAPASESETRTQVDWSAYAPTTKEIIDGAEVVADCEALQGMFDVADNAGFLDQMKYIDEALRTADCY